MKRAGEGRRKKGREKGREKGKERREKEQGNILVALTFVYVALGGWGRVLGRGAWLATVVHARPLSQHCCTRTRLVILHRYTLNVIM